MGISNSDGYALVKKSESEIDDTFLYPICGLVESDGWIIQNRLTLQEEANVKREIMEMLKNIVVEVTKKNLKACSNLV